MYALEIVIVIGAVYLAPALAVRPALALRPETAAAIPILSVLVVGIVQAGLASSGLYTPLVVQSLSAVFVLAAVLRVAASVRKMSGPSAWADFTRLVFILNVALCIYFGAALLLHGFDLDDEIYSWNLWALQHFLGEPVDYYYTRAPYPQLFPKLLSYCYMVLGGIEPQTAVKTSLIVFPFTVFTALGLASTGNRKTFLILHLLLCYFILREAGLKEIFDDGMPDTLTAAAIAASVYLLECYRRRRESLELLCLALACAVVAVLAKQPALVWGLFSLPVILATDAARGKDAWSRAALGLIPAACAVAWMLTEGRSFQDNTGVLARSFADRNLPEQLWFGANRYFVHEPAIAALLLIAVFAVARSARGIAILLAFVLPSLLTWFLFAAYDLRAGAPALVVLGYLIASGNYGLGGTATEPAPAPMTALFKYALPLVVFALALEQAASKITREISRNDGYVVGFTQRNNLIGLFGADAGAVFDQLMNNPAAKLWAPTNYVYGLFYGHIDVTRPSYDRGTYTPKMLVDELRHQHRNYATNAGDAPYGPGGDVLDRLIARDCPKLFTPVAGPNNRYHITVYKIDTELLATGYCDL